MRLAHTRRSVIVRANYNVPACYATRPRGTLTQPVVTFRFSEGLSRRGPAGAVNIVSPLHLHKGLSRANYIMPAVVSPCAE
jgi:hypothetical protein